MKTRRDDPDFPMDVGWHFLPILIALIAGSLTSMIMNAGPVWMAGYVAGVLVLCQGARLMFQAKLPMYRQRRFFTFGPGILPPESRPVYWRSLRWIGAGFGVCVLLLAARFLLH